MSKFKVGDQVSFIHWQSPYPKLVGKIIEIKSSEHVSVELFRLNPPHRSKIYSMELYKLRHLTKLEQVLK